MQKDTTLRLRQLGAADLDAANAIITAALATWNLPERVKRLSLPIYRYDHVDLDHLTLTGAARTTNDLVGIAAWEPASASDTPPSATGLLLHGIYVLPAQHRSGIGGFLLAAAVSAAEKQGFDGLLVKASPDARDFFAASGLRRLPEKDIGRDYPYRFWLDLRSERAA